MGVQGCPTSCWGVWRKKWSATLPVRSSRSGSANAQRKTEQADRLFQQITETSTLSETQYNYARFLAGQGKPVEARQWAQKILAKKATMPRYLKRRERPWFRKAASLIKKLPQTKVSPPPQGQAQQA